MPQFVSKPSTFHTIVALGCSHVAIFGDVSYWTRPQNSYNTISQKIRHQGTPKTTFFSVQNKLTASRSIFNDLGKGLLLVVPAYIYNILLSMSYSDTLITCFFFSALLVASPSMLAPVHLTDRKLLYVSPSCRCRFGTVTRRQVALANYYPTAVAKVESNSHPSVYRIWHCQVETTLAWQASCISTRLRSYPRYKQTVA